MQDLLKDLKEEMAELSNIREGNYELEYLLEEEKEKEPKTFVEVVTKILYRYDPSGLAEAYFIEYKYSEVARQIVNHLRELKDLTEMRWMIHEKCTGGYYASHTLPSSHKCYRYMAEEIWEAWKEELERRKVKKSEAIFGRA